MASIKSTGLYIAGLVILFILSFTCIFNEKIDLNGDNCDYYMLATSLAGGHGYSEITSGDYNPVNSFPPGYPLLMTPIRMFTASFVPQKILNGLFLLGAAILLFFFIRKNRLPGQMAFIASAAMLVNDQALHFATMMMSEMSLLFFSILTLCLLSKIDDRKPFWKDGYFYLTILTTAFCYHIRTQGIALAAAIIGFFLFTKQWKQMLAFAGGFIVCLLPWIIRNKLTGMGQSRYLDAIMMSNAWRPDEGTLGVGELISRFFNTFRMLLTKAVPNSILPYFNVEYGSATTWGEWGIAILLFALIGIGLWQLGKYRYVFLFYILATFSVISIFSTPSENRYITSLLPFIEVGMLIGLFVVLSAGVQRLKIAQSFSPLLFAFLFLCCSYPRLETLRKQNKAPFPPAYRNFFSIGETVRRELPSNTVVCSRKPNLFYMYGKTPVCNYTWTEDDKALIEGLIQAKADYVVLEQLGYSSTPLYLYPAIRKHPDLFETVLHLPNPDTYLLKFNREKAKEKIH
ncbi:MAG: hypothetical protein LBQ39_00110 [Tannerellaceae bacterium]|jgi:hypothetical protein|nr:hypothetical protein [Tannerellaceae bacterium]